MKVLKTIGLLLVSIVLYICMLPMNILVVLIEVLETILKITRETITFLIKSIKSEVLKPFENGDNNETES